MIRLFVRLADRLPSGVRQTATYALTPVIAKAVSFAMVPVFTHFLAPEDYGRLDVLQTLADLLSILIGLGLADTLFRFAGSAPDDAARRRAAANLFGLSLVSAVAFRALKSWTTTLPPFTKATASPALVQTGFCSGTASSVVRRVTFGAAPPSSAR